MKKTNFHTHTTFCDGKNTLEENVLEAIEKGFDLIGFSSHSMLPFSSDWHLNIQDYGTYSSEIERLKTTYSDKIKILKGFEADYIPGMTLPSFSTYERFKPDYLIGSVHYVYDEKGTFIIDASPDELQKMLKDVFNDNVKEMVSTYFSLQREMLNKGDFNIIGHPDLITKFNDELKLFDESESWYKSELIATADEIAKKGVIAEINTGAISRGYKKVPYPCKTFLELLKERNVPITINSDAHEKNALDCAFEDAIQLAKSVGYTEAVVDISNGTFVFDKL